MGRQVYRNDSQLNIFAATIYAEARGEVDPGQQWVGWVIKNRALANWPKGGNTIKGVCLAEDQFSCWNNTDHIQIDEEKAWTKALQVATEVTNSNSDPTSGSNHYYAARGPNRIPAPDWTARCDFIKSVGNHDFYRYPKKS